MAAYSGPSFSTERHTHFLAQLCFAVDTPLRLRGRNGKWVQYKAAFIPSGTSHETEKCPSPFILIFFDPLTIGAGLFTRRPIIVGEPAIEVSDLLSVGEINSIARALTDASEHAKLEILTILQKHCVPPAERPMDLRIRASIEKIAEDIPSLAELAATAKLSPSRFRHLFRDETGIALSGYKVWMKTRKAITLLGAHPKLSHAAYQAGFADQAHFSRVFRRSFGMSPSAFKNHEAFQLKIFRE